MTQMTVTTDFVSYRRQVEQYAKLTGVSLKDAMEESVAILSGQLARRFPPKSMSQGRKAIKNDMERVFIPDTDVSITGEIDDSRVMLVFNSGAKLAVDNSLYKPGLSESGINGYYESKRVGKKHRPPKGYGKAFYQRGMKHTSKMYVSGAALKSAIKNRQAKVGDLKANWTAGTALGGAAKVPAWVSRHGRKGHLINAMKLNGNGYIEFTNPLKYASNWADINAFVVRSQGKMFAHRIRAVLKKQTDAANARRSA